MVDRVVTGALFRTATEGLLWPAVPGRAAAELLAQLYQLEQTQYFPQSLLKLRQLQQFVQLARHAAETSAFYAERFRSVGLSPAGPWTWELFTQLPLLTRRELLTCAPQIHSQRSPQPHGPWHELQTSGSTGEVVAVRRTGVSQLLWLALNMRDHLWHQRDFRRSLCVIRAGIAVQDDDAVAREAGWGPPVSLLHDSGPCYTRPLSTDVAELARWLVEKDPDYLLTYPTALAGLLDRFQSTGQQPRKLGEVRTIGETLTPALRARCQALLGVPIVDAYSAQEVGAIALQCRDSNLYHVHAESLIVEVLNADGRACAPGETGRVVVTDLHNFATPIIRYELRDYAEVGPSAGCACGRGLPTLTRVLGRQRNMVVLPNGQRYWPLVGLHHFREVAQILQYQLIQHDLAQVEMRLVTAAPLEAAAETRLIQIVQEALGHPFQIRLTYVDGQLERSAGGKFEEFVCRVAEAEA
jgi:phenylacetate-CoA ligase